MERLTRNRMTTWKTVSVFMGVYEQMRAATAARVDTPYLAYRFVGYRFRADFSLSPMLICNKVYRALCLLIRSLIDSPFPKMSPRVYAPSMCTGFD